jgi:hypothetical protein
MSTVYASHPEKSVLSTLLLSTLLPCLRFCLPFFSDKRRHEKCSKINKSHPFSTLSTLLSRNKEEERKEGDSATFTKVLKTSVDKVTTVDIDLKDLCDTGQKAWDDLPLNGTIARFSWHGKNYTARHSSFRLLIDTDQGEPVTARYM